MGRAGRDGKRSLCLLLYSKKDRGLHSYFITSSKAEQSVLNQRWRSLEAITQFVESAECRHAGILTYFRDTDRIDNCGHCDVCAPNDAFRVPRTNEVTRASTKTRKRRRQEPAAHDNGPEAEARALIIRDWRKRFAKERDVPAFIIFSDKTLRDLAARNPRNLLELEQVYGLGPAKIELFGNELLKELGQC